MKIKSLLRTLIFVLSALLIVGTDSQVRLVLAAADKTAPTVPTGLASSNVQMTQVTLTWNASTDNVGVTGYIVKRNGSQVGTTPGTVRTFNDTGLTPNTTYSYTVSAKDAANNTSANSSPALSVKTLADTVAPSVPSGLTAPASSLKYTTMTLNWSASTDNVGVTGYTVFRNGSQVGTTSGTVRTFNDTGLTPNTTYAYTVSAKDAANNTSAVSSALSVKTLADTTAPSAPSSLTGVGKSTQVTLTWTASTDNVAVTGYIISRNGLPTKTPVTVTGTTYTDTGLTSNTNYTYTVKATDAVGNTASSTLTVLTDITAPTVPSGLTAPASSLKYTTMTLNWSASTDNVGVTGYTVFRNGTQVGTTSGTVRTFNDTGLTSNTTYAYTVKATDAAGNISAASSALNVKTLADTVPPTAPSSLTGIGKSTQVTLTWTASTDNVAVTGYIISRNGLPTKTPVTVTGTTYTDTGLTSNTNYTYTVKATDAVGNTASSTLTVLTDITAPTAPSGLTGIGQPTQVTLNWIASTDNVGVTGYIISRNGLPTKTPVTVTGTTYIDTGLKSNTSYLYTVKVTDAAGNTTSSTLTVLTDATAPSKPANLTRTVQGTGVTLNWTTSTDNVGVIGYVITRNGTALPAVVTGTTYTDTAITPATTYSYTVAAKDAGGNTSLASNAVSATTQSTPCVASSPAGTYIITICITVPADGATITGITNVTTSVTIPGTHPAVGTLVYSLDGQYLLTDFNNPLLAPTTFQLPSQNFVDGTHSLSVYATLSDANSTILTPAAISLTFANGVTTPPTNPNTFTPYKPVVTGRPLILAATGDGADGQSPAVPNRIASWNPDLFLYLGDVYNKGTLTEFQNWYGSPASYFGQLRNITNPVVGNHEYEVGIAPGYYDYWNLGPATVQNEPRSYYSYNAGGWHFIALNSNELHSNYLAPGSAEYTWLANDLATNTAVCTIAYFHHPTFNVGPEGYKTTMMPMWALMANNGVDVILTGHDHDYQRWLPLDANGSATSTLPKMTEFIAGGGGHGTQQPITTDSRLVTGAYTTPNAFGALRMELNATGMQFQYINQAGSVLDSGAIPCNGTTDTIAPTAPTNLTATPGANVVLNWNASTDATGIAGYTVYRNGVALTTTLPGVLSYTDYAVQLNHTYSYTVDAFDPSGNHSALSNAAATTTPITATYVLNPIADSYVTDLSPTFNFGVSTALRTDLTPVQNSYLRFTLPALSGNVISASLNVYNNGTGNELYGYTVSTTAGGWTETGITSGNAPAQGTIIGTSGSFPRGGWTTVNVGPAITAAGDYNFVMTANFNTANLYDSREGVNRPQLVITVTGDAVPPSPPSGLATTDVQGTQVSLTWTASTDNIGVTNYVINRNGLAVATIGPVTTYTDVGLAPGTTYQYTVVAKDAAGNTSTLSNQLGVTTSSIGTLTVTATADSYVQSDLQNNNFGNTAALVTDLVPVQNSYLRFVVPTFAGHIASAKFQVFANSASSVGYTLSSTASGWTETGINYSNAPAALTNFGGSGAIVLGTWTTVDVTSLVTATGEYNFVMMANNNTQTSFSSRTGANAPKLVLTLTNDVVPPSAPTSLTPANVQETQLTLNWVAATDNVGVTSYVINRNGIAVGTVGPVTSFTDTGLTASTLYHYTVVAKDGANNASAPSNQVDVTTPDVTAPSAPTSLTGVAQANKVTLNWAASTDNVAVTGYIISRNNNVLATVGLVTTYTDLTVSPDTTYQYTITARDAVGNISLPSTPLTVTPLSPATNLTATNVQPTQATLNWTASTSAGVTGYTINRDGAAIATVGAVTTYTDQTLIADSVYQYTVTAQDAAGNTTTVSNSINVDTHNAGTITLNPIADSYVDSAVTTPSGSATILRTSSAASSIKNSYLRFQVPAVVGNITSVTLRVFANSASTVGYTLSNTTGAWTESGLVYTNIPPTGSSIGTSGTFVAGVWTTINLTPVVINGGEYNFVMTGNNTTSVSYSSREGANKPELVITLSNDVLPPSAPANLATANVQETQLDLNWTASTDNVGVTGYIVKRGGVIVATLGTVTTYTDTGLTAGTTYQYTVNALDAAGNPSVASSLNVTTADVTAPSAPTTLAASNIQATQATLTWTVATDNVAVTNYIINRDGVAVATVGAVTTFTDTGLTASTAYQYTVVAKDAVGNTSAVSNTLDVTTTSSLDTTPPTAPNGLVGIPDTTQITLNWTASTDNVGVTAYVVTRTGASPITLGAVTTYTDTGLTSGTLYQYSVVAKDAAGNTSTASTVSVTTLVPGAVGTITLSPTADTYIDQAAPTANNATNTSLRVSASTTATKNSYLRFQVPSLGGSVVSATLKVFATSASNPGYKVYSTASGWTAAGLNWNTASAFGPIGNSLGTSGIFSANTLTSVNVTSLVTAGGEYNLLMTAINTPTQTQFNFASSESTPPANRPVLVIVVNTPPVAVNDSGYSINANAILTVPVGTGILANDTDADANTLTAVKVSDPAHGTVTLNSNGSFTYTPAANFSGSDSFTYKTNDGRNDSNTATVSITVNAVNTPPVAVNDSYTTNQDTTLTVAVASGVLSNDSDVDAGTTLTAVLITDAAHGSLGLVPNGSFTYTPVAGYSGPDSFTYKAYDGVALSNVATVSITVNAVLPPAPVANFTPSVTGGTAPLDVTFTNTSTGSITGYSWNFGDGSPADTSASPTHTYAAQGTYTVTLTASGPGGSNNATAIITVSAALLPTPVASFTPSVTSGTAPLNVTFTNTSTNATSYGWDFGDGSPTDTSASPTHTYAAQGTYTVTLTASGPGGSNNATATITVSAAPPPAPVANFTPSVTGGTAPLDVTFTNTSTNATSYSWDFGDGSPTDTSASPTHTYASAGTFTVTLTADGTATATATITVN